MHKSKKKAHESKNIIFIKNYNEFPSIRWGSNCRLIEIDLFSLSNVVQLEKDLND